MLGWPLDGDGFRGGCRCYGGKGVVSMQTKAELGIVSVDNNGACNCEHHISSLEAALMRPHHPQGSSPRENLGLVYWAGGANVSHFEHLFTLTAVHPQLS